MHGGKRLTYRFIKRFFDVLLSLVSILIIFVPSLLIVLGCVLSTGASPLYCDERLGKNGKTIKVLKYRTMFKDANSKPDKYLNRRQMKEFSSERKVFDDPRVTPFGSFLRRFSLDELPQFWNVLIGDMSLVGPRPITESEMTANFNPAERKQILSVRPGITGVWQVYGRSDDTWASGARKKLALSYFDKRGLWFDIKLFFLTLPSCVSYSRSKH